MAPKKDKPPAKRKGKVTGKVVRRRGTPLTQDVRTKILDGLRAGLHPDTAANLAGVDPSSLSLWMKRGAEGVKNFKEFREEVHKALAECEAGSLIRINKAAQAGDWRAAAWTLERRFNERWGRKDKVDNSHRLGGDENPESTTSVVKDAMTGLIGLMNQLSDAKSEQE